MSTDNYFRGGSSLKPRPGEVQTDPTTGLLRPTRGASVFNRPDNLDRFGGAYRVTQLPVELRIIRRGPDPSHFEIVPARPMTLQQVEEALGKIVLI